MKLNQLKEDVGKLHFLSFFLHDAGVGPSKVQDLGSFEDLDEAKRASLSFFKYQFIPSVLRDTGIGEQEDLAEMIRNDYDEVASEEFTEFKGRGGRLWILGSGDYVFIVKWGSYANINDLLE